MGARCTFQRTSDRAQSPADPFGNTMQRETIRALGEYTPVHEDASASVRTVGIWALAKRTKSHRLCRRAFHDSGVPDLPWIMVCHGGKSTQDCISLLAIAADLYLRPNWALGGFDRESKTNDPSSLQHHNITKQLRRSCPTHCLMEGLTMACLVGWCQRYIVLCSHTRLLAFVNLITDYSTAITPTKPEVANRQHFCPSRPP